jgi:hypothetical protein
MSLGRSVLGLGTRVKNLGGNENFSPWMFEFGRKKNFFSTVIAVNAHHHHSLLNTHYQKKIKTITLDRQYYG